MRRKSNPLIPAGLLLGMCCLILDSECASKSAGQAIVMCLQTVIPSLFPMFVLSGLMVQHWSLGRLSALLESAIAIPSGSGALFLIGLTGGFPVGAQCIHQSVSRGGLSVKDGERMLGLCNHCGPAFLFGVTTLLFSTIRLPLILFLIQGECALLLARYWPGNPGKSVPYSGKPVGITEGVGKAIESMSFVCAWILLANVLCGFLDRWVFTLLPPIVPVLIHGVLELTGGVLSLDQIPSEAQRFLLCCAMINWGGVCVHLQIQSLAAKAGLSSRICIRQKVIQSALSVLIGAGYLALGPIGLLFPLILLVPGKKMWKNRSRPCIMAAVREVSNHAVPKENTPVLPILSVQRKAE